jgi:hypothetical protein
MGKTNRLASVTTLAKQGAKNAVILFCRQRFSLKKAAIELTIWFVAASRYTAS